MYVGCRLQLAIESSVAGTRFLVSVCHRQPLRSDASSPGALRMFRCDDEVKFRNAALLRRWLETDVSSHRFRGIKSVQQRIVALCSAMDAADRIALLGISEMKGRELLWSQTDRHSHAGMELKSRFRILGSGSFDFDTASSLPPSDIAQHRIRARSDHHTSAIKHLSLIERLR